MTCHIPNSINRDSNILNIVIEDDKILLLQLLRIDQTSFSLHLSVLMEFHNIQLTEYYLEQYDWDPWTLH